jgi:hypothetical protein
MVVEDYDLSIEEIQLLNKLDVVVVDLYDKFYEFDYLMTNAQDLTSAMMVAINTDKPIISIRWLDMVKDFQKWVEPTKFPFRSQAIENRYDFTLTNTIKMGKLNEVRFSLFLPFIDF